MKHNRDDNKKSPAGQRGPTGLIIRKQSIVSEGEVDTEVEGGVGAHRHKLLGTFAHGAVHTEEHIKSGGVEIEHPAKAHAIGTHSEVHVGREALDGVHVSRDASLGPGVFAGEACGAEEAEVQLAVHGQGIVDTHVEGGMEGARTRADVAHVGELVQVLEVVGEAVPLVLKGVGGITIGAEHIGVGLDGAVAVGRCVLGVGEVDEAQVESSQREGEVAPLILGTEVKGYTEAVGTKGVLAVEVA